MKLTWKDKLTGPTIIRIVLGTAMISSCLVGSICAVWALVEGVPASLWTVSTALFGSVLFLMIVHLFWEEVHG